MIKMDLILEPGWEEHAKKEINSICVSEILDRFKKAKQTIELKIYSLVDRLIKDTPEYDSITNGTLHGQLGIVNPIVALEKIIDRIIHSAQVFFDFKIVGESIEAELSIHLIKEGYDDLLSLPTSKFVSEHGYNIEWLYWLLISGNDVIIVDYKFRGNLNSVSKKFSRTQKGLMLKSKNAIWKVPYKYSGVPEDNFIIRAFTYDTAVEEIRGVLEKSLMDHLE